MINTKIAKVSRAVVAKAKFALDSAILRNKRIDELEQSEQELVDAKLERAEIKTRTDHLESLLTKPLNRYAQRKSGVYGSLKAQAVADSQLAYERKDWWITTIENMIKDGKQTRVDTVPLQTAWELAEKALHDTLALEAIKLDKRDARKEELLKKRLELAEQPIHLYAKKTPDGYRFLTDDLRKGIQKRTGNIAFPSLVEGVTENGKCIEGNCFDIRKLRRWLVLHKGIVALVKVHTPTEQEGQRFGNVAPQIRFVIQRTMNSMLAQTSTFVLKAETGIVHSVRLG